MRPAIILCFGGAFIFGNKNFEDMRALADSFAKRGFVAAIIQYRVGINILSDKSPDRGTYRALQDTRSAIRYFRADADNENKYRIDPNHILIGGYSSGAVASLNNAFLDKESERPASTYETTYTYRGTVLVDEEYDNELDIEFIKEQIAKISGVIALDTDVTEDLENKLSKLGTIKIAEKATYKIPDLGCLDCVGDNKQYNGKANGIVGFAGGISDLNFIESSNEIPCITFHSTDDKTVPFGAGAPFGIEEPLGPGTIYGSHAIYEKSQAIGAIHKLYVYDNRKHDVLYEPNKKANLYPEIIPNTVNFFYEHIFKKLTPNAVSINGVSKATENSITEYKVTNSEYTDFEWNVVGGEIVSISDDKKTVSVLWGNKRDINSIGVRTRNKHGMLSTESKINVLIKEVYCSVSPNPRKISNNEPLRIVTNDMGADEIQVLLVSKDNYFQYALSDSFELNQISNHQKLAILNLGIKYPAGNYFLRITIRDKVFIRNIILL